MNTKSEHLKERLKFIDEYTAWLKKLQTKFDKTTKQNNKQITPTLHANNVLTYFSLFRRKEPYSNLNLLELKQITPKQLIKFIHKKLVLHFFKRFISMFNPFSRTIVTASTSAKRALISLIESDFSIGTS